MLVIRKPRNGEEEYYADLAQVRLRIPEVSNQDKGDDDGSQPIKLIEMLHF